MNAADPFTDSVEAACAVTVPGVVDVTATVHFPFTSVFAPAAVQVPAAAAWAAPFAPMPYATVFAMINAGNFGLCQMASMAQDHTAGVVEGFTLRMAAPRCPNGQRTEQVVLR